MAGNLAGEVLDQQPDAASSSLLCTSVLERICAPLGDAVTGAGDAREMLGRVGRSNYFLIPLDPRREWYRYHNLFTELLRHELERRLPGSTVELRRRAGRWLGMPAWSRKLSPTWSPSGISTRLPIIAAYAAPFATGERGARGPCGRSMARRASGRIRRRGRSLALGKAGVALALGPAMRSFRGRIAPNRLRTTGSTGPTFASRATVRRAAAWQLLGDVRLSRKLAEQVMPLDGSSRDHALAGSEAWERRPGGSATRRRGRRLPRAAWASWPRARSRSCCRAALRTPGADRRRRHKPRAEHPTSTSTRALRPDRGLKSELEEVLDGFVHLATGEAAGQAEEDAAEAQAELTRAVTLGATWGSGGRSRHTR